MQEELEEKKRSIGELESKEHELKLENRKLNDALKSLHEQSCKEKEAVRQRNIRRLATVLQVLFVLAILGVVAILLFWSRDQFPSLKSLVVQSVSGFGGLIVSILGVVKRECFVKRAERFLSKRQ